MTLRPPFPASIVCALAASLALAAPHSAQAQQAALDWTAPPETVELPPESRTRSLRLSGDGAAAMPEMGEERGFIPIAPIIPRPAPLGPRSWQICNSSGHETVSIAIAVPQGPEWEVRGWLTLAQGDCRTVLERSTANEVYYFAHPHAGRLAGWQHFCINPDHGFQTVASRECEEGYKPVGFRRVELDRHTIRTDIR